MFIPHCIGNYHLTINSLAPGRFEWNFRHVIFKLMSAIDGWGILCEISLIWMSLDFTDGQSTLVQVMAWCVRQQAIAWVNVDPDLCHHMVSLGHNELTVQPVMEILSECWHFLFCEWSSIERCMLIDWYLTTKKAGKLEFECCFLCWVIFTTTVSY